MKHPTLKNLIKVPAWALILTMLTIVVMSCSKVQDADPSQDLFDKISGRFKSDDFASISNNPHADFGKEMKSIYQSILQSANHEFYYGNSFVSSNAEDVYRLKSLTKRELTKQDILFSEEYIDRFSENVKDYKLTSEDVTKYLAEATQNKTITSFEHDLITLELQEMAAATSSSRLRSIIRTVEYEVINSNIPSSSKDKILLFNALAMNSIIENPGAIASRSVPNLSSSPFRKTTPVMVATVLVVWAAVAIIEAWTDPGCDNACRVTMTGNALTYVVAGQLVCEFYGSGQNCPCLDTDCWLDSAGRCVCL